MIKLTKLLLNLTKMWLKRIKNFLKKPKPKKPRKKRKTKPKPKLIIRKCTQLPLKLERAISNPIMEPKYKNKWESWQTFNPAAIYLNNKVHFLYRAIGEGGLSVFGYASSKNGIHIDERSETPAYALKRGFLESLTKTNAPGYSSGGSVSGCEDPRIAEIDGTIYLIYTTFSNWSELRLTLTSISKDDFLNKKWDQWKKPVFISAPNEIHKNWVLFPEKINNKYAILHSISPNIQIDYFDSLDELDGKTFIKSSYSRSYIKDGWEAYFRGVGPSPIKTSKGWLVLYHAEDKKDTSKYKLGAMILDLKDPTKILYRAKQPVLEPSLPYENNGFKSGIVYSCGAVVIDDTLFVYYGGADTVVCVATANLEEFIEPLTQKLRKTSFIKKLKK
ncbi:MAG: glycosidase [Minisyncoccales bacterium]|jgi:predicted GH43/DUF377 family glycosyl hydrolase